MNSIKLFAARNGAKELLAVGEMSDDSVSLVLSQAPSDIALRETELEKCYSRLREQVNAENNLYVQRIYWLIFIQAFLFASVGLALQTVFDSSGKNSTNFALHSFLVMVAVVGVFVGVVCHILFTQARNALDELGAMWVQAMARFGGDEEVLLLFPDVRGGSNKKDSPKGNRRAIKIFRSGNLGAAFSLSWLILIAVFLYSVFFIS